MAEDIGKIDLMDENAAEKYLETVMNYIRERRDLLTDEIRTAWFAIQTMDPRELHPKNKLEGHYIRVIKNNSIEKISRLIKPSLDVTLTTYPPRIRTVYKTIETIHKQTIKPDKLLLWLAYTDFPGRERDMPDSLMDMVAAGTLTIKWCEDLKPHKKYFFAMLEMPDDILVTIDDDLYYDDQMIERVYLSYLEFPEAVSASRCHLIRFDENGHFLPYLQWPQNQGILLNRPTMELFPTNGAGSLFPPHIFDRSLFDIDTIKRVCLSADDLWLKVMEVLSDVPVVVAAPPRRLNYVSGTQEVGLWHDNVSENGNDVQLRKIKKLIDEKYEPDYLENAILHSKKNADFSIYDMYNQRRSLDGNWRKRIEKEKKDLVIEMENYRSYKIGRAITMIPRKIRDLLKRA